MKKNILIFIFSGAFGVCSAQSLVPQVVSSAGGAGSSAMGSLEWTVGEAVINTATDGNFTLTQGFHQPLLVIPTDVQSIEANAAYSVFPNPTADYVRVKFNTDKNQSCNYKLFDIEGKIIREGVVTTQNPDISFLNMASGKYIISLFNTHHKTQNFSIIKQN
ncbi:MAG: T9SS type A sorting domain-containing protein [Bacteroidia bacterium]|nr:T9SS type A sorting domain-containing protein [Bacteroidia bacterium]